MWSDVESSEDYLNFGEVSDLAVDILSAKNMLPISIGIFGNWGAGKSSLLKLIETKLEDDEQDYIVINFDAWLYQGFDDARASLLEVIATRLLEEVAGESASMQRRLDCPRIAPITDTAYGRTGHRCAAFTSHADRVWHASDRFNPSLSIDRRRYRSSG